MQSVTKILKFLETSAKLKAQERSIKISNIRMESVADHSWHLALLVLLIYPRLTKRVDLLRALKMALIHDLPEAEVGDIPYGLVAKNPLIRTIKQNNEREAMFNMAGLIGGTRGKELFDIWNEYENGSTGEAKLIKALDSLEANYQSILYDVGYWDKEFYPIALTKANQYCAYEPILWQLNIAITKQMASKIKGTGVDIDSLDWN